MLRNANPESEILLGNTQLIGIFFLLAVLLGVAFTAGFMLGHGSFSKKTEAVTALSSAPPADAGARTVVVDPAPNSANSPSETATLTASASPLGGKSNTPEKAQPSPTAPPPAAETAPPRPDQIEGFAPQPGQTFLQVAAELHDSAASAASVLNKAGFNAHVVLAPSGKLFRVLVGPVKDKSDLALTRDALKAKGFLKVIVRNY